MDEDDVIMADSDNENNKGHHEKSDKSKKEFKNKGTVSESKMKNK